MLANAVFEGGGVKAIGLAGAVQAAEEHGIRFAKLAGTSSGSMIAAFLAAGYTADEIKQLILTTPFTSFLKRSGLFQVKGIGPVIRLLLKKGLYSGEALEQWVRELLLAKGIRTFGDLEPDKLRIIASDITLGRLLVLPDDVAQYGIDPVKFEVAKAIRMSTSIPYFFDPVIVRKSLELKQKGEPFRSQFVYVVDGGLLSNFPLWLFDRENDPDALAQMTPTLGFQLVGKGTGQPNDITGPFTMLKALFSTMMDAHDERFIEEHNRFRTIKIPTLGVHTTQFDISTEQSELLFESGVEAGRKFFDRWSLASYTAQYKKRLVERV